MQAGRPHFQSGVGSFGLFPFELRIGAGRGLQTRVDVFIPFPRRENSATYFAQPTSFQVQQTASEQVPPPFGAKNQQVSGPRASHALHLLLPEFLPYTIAVNAHRRRFLSRRIRSISDRYTSGCSGPSPFWIWVYGSGAPRHQPRQSSLIPAKGFKPMLGLCQGLS